MNKVTISDFEMSFGSMVVFIFKWIFASIFALMGVIIVVAPILFILLLLLFSAR